MRLTEALAQAASGDRIRSTDATFVVGKDAYSVTVWSPRGPAARVTVEDLLREDWEVCRHE